MDKNTTKPILINKEIKEMHLELSILRKEKQKCLLEKADLQKDKHQAKYRL